MVHHPQVLGQVILMEILLVLLLYGTSGTLWVSKNGVWQNSATQSEIEAGTTTNSLATGIDTTKDLFPYIQDYR